MGQLLGMLHWAAIYYLEALTNHIVARAELSQSAQAGTGRPYRPIKIRLEGHGRQIGFELGFMTPDPA